jgi:nucleoside-diphosphate-sugar epimerase
MSETVLTEAALLELLTRPSPALVEFISRVSSPLVVLGAGGKMGPTLCVLARRAADAAGHALEVIAVSRFSDPVSRRWLETAGVKVISADLLEREAMRSLPDAENLIYLLGLKFGTSQNPALTWAVNTLPPAHVAERYPRARIVALSTGNVYPFVPVTEGGAREDHPLTPVGEYANAAIARERLFEYFSAKQGTPVALLRLSFAVELRYGVLVDIGQRVWEERPIDLVNGTVNWIWQGDANDLILRALPLASSPAGAWNLTHPEPLRVREVATQFGELFHKEPRFTGHEAGDSLLSTPAKLCARLGRPPTPPEQVIAWIAGWIRNGGANWNKPTHFEVRDGQY